MFRPRLGHPQIHKQFSRTKRMRDLELVQMLQIVGTI